MGVPNPLQREAHQVVHEPAGIDAGMQVARAGWQFAVCYQVAKARATLEIKEQVNRIDQVDPKNRLQLLSSGTQQRTQRPVFL